MLSDTGCAQCGIAGLLPGTLLHGLDGWHDVADLRAGDWIRSVGSAPAQLTAITTRTIWLHPGTCPETVCPVTVPAGAIGNRRAMTLLPDIQILLVPHGEPAAVLPPAVIRAGDLRGFRGIRAMQPQETTIAYLPHFNEWQAVGLGQGLIGVVAPPVVDPAGFIEHFDRTPLGDPDLVYLDHGTARAYLDRLGSATEDGGLAEIVLPRSGVDLLYRA